MQTLRGSSGVAVAAWAVAIGVAAIVVARWSAFGVPGPREILGGVAAVAVPAVLVHLHRDRPIVVGAVLLACSSTVIAATADGRWQGVLALLVVTLASWSGRPVVAAALAVVAAVGTGLWWRSGFDRGSAPGPSARDVVGETGAVVRRALTSVGADELLVPLSGVLVWWVGIGLVAGGAIVAGRPWRATWIPAAAAYLVVGIWTIRLLRGSVDPVGGTWIVSAGIVLASVSVELPPGARRRVAGTIAVAATAAWGIAFVRELRAESGWAAALAVVGALVAAAGLVAGPRAALVSAPAGDARAG